MESFLDVLIPWAIAIPSIILHEVSHGFAALRFGDDTAKRRGRLTLNPISHVDPIGTIILPGLLALSGLGVIGYAKPVPVNVSRLKSPRNDAVLVALAGPATNITIAVVAALAFRLVGSDFDLDSESVEWNLTTVLIVTGILNLLLAFFNLIPIPPLDGSAVIERALPTRWMPRWYQLRRYSIYVLLAVFILLPLVSDRSVGDLIVDPAISVWEALAG